MIMRETQLWERKKHGDKFIEETKCNEIYVIAIEMKMEFLNNGDAP